MPSVFRKVSCSVLKHFPTNPLSLLQIHSIPTCYRCENFGAFSSLPFFSPLEVAKQPWAEVGHHGQCWIWSYCITADSCKPPFPDNTWQHCRATPAHFSAEGSLYSSLDTRSRKNNILFFQLEPKLTKLLPLFPKWRRLWRLWSPGECCTPSNLKATSYERN